jgi:hypothetical protein
MKADDVLAIRCKLVEQAPAHCRGSVRFVMVGGRQPIRMRERDCGMDYHRIQSRRNLKGDVPSGVT